MADEQSTASTPSQPEVAEVITQTTPVKTFSEDDINRIVKERLDRERKKYADYDDLKSAKSRLDEIELANKSKEEQAVIKLQALEAKIAESEKLVRAAEIKEKKRAALESAGLSLPKDVTNSELLDMMHGETDEDISTVINKFKKLFPATKSAGVGTQVSEAPVAGKKTVDEQMFELNAAMKKPGITQKEREEMTRQVIKLSNMKMRGMI